MTPMFFSVGGSGGNLLWLVLLVAAGVTVLCVGVHYETLRLIIHLGQRRKARSSRLALSMVIVLLLIAHLIEAAIFAGAYHLVFLFPESGAGRLTGAYDGTFGDCLYFSLSVYTTVGFGDIVPEGPVRLMVGIEALTGLVLITWSASFTFLAMHRLFKRQLDS